ncbi:MAG TPA: hypothetical protein VF707_05695 [Ardenticatenaceae bacterium]|jgi:hypothetical protein
MQTTLDIDEDVLLAARELAEREHISVGSALSRLARQSLGYQEAPSQRNGVPLFPYQPEGQVTMLERVNRLRDEE